MAPFPSRSQLRVKHHSDLSSSFLLRAVSKAEISELALIPEAAAYF